MLIISLSKIIDYIFSDRFLHAYNESEIIFCPNEYFRRLLCLLSSSFPCNLPSFRLWSPPRDINPVWVGCTGLYLPVQVPSLLYVTLLILFIIWHSFRSVVPFVFMVFIKLCFNIGLTMGLWIRKIDPQSKFCACVIMWCKLYVLN